MINILVFLEMITLSYYIITIYKDCHFIIYTFSGEWHYAKTIHIPKNNQKSISSIENSCKFAKR